MKIAIRKNIIGRVGGITLAVTILAWGAPAIAASSGQSALHAMLPASIQKTGVVTLATNGDSAPCESFASNGSNKLVGYEVDLWNAMGTALGVKIDPSSISFDSIIPGVQSGRFDMAMSCISDSTTREKVVSFVDDAYATGEVYTLTSNHSITTNPLTLCGQKTATVVGEDYQQTIQTILSPYCTMHGKAAISSVELPSVGDVLLSLYTGRISFALEDNTQVTYIKKHSPKPVRYVDDRLLQKYYNGMVFPKSSGQLQKAFLAALKAMHADGKYMAILNKWGFADVNLPHPGINLSASNPLPEPKA